MQEYFALVVGAILVNNFVLSRFLGICPFLGVSRRLDTALGMSGAVLFVMTLASAATAAINRFVLLPFRLGYLQTIVFILVIASLVQLVEIVLQRFSPPLYRALGIYLPLITTNCAVLGVAVLAAWGEVAVAGRVHERAAGGDADLRRHAEGDQVLRRSPAALPVGALRGDAVRPG